MTKISRTHHRTKTGVIKKNPKSSLYNTVWDNNKGIFYRGNNGRVGIGDAVLGNGMYFSWSEGMAKAFAKMSAEMNGGTPTVKKYRLPKNLKMMDFQGEDSWKIRQGLGVQNRWDKISDPMYNKLFTGDVKSLGYDGVISDDKADGLVVFDASNVEEI